MNRPVRPSAHPALIRNKLPRQTPLALSVAALAPRHWLMLASALPGMAWAASPLPTGGSVVAGSATISSPNANTMVIQQASDKAIINWQGYSIGTSGYVQYVQPSSAAIALNRVVGADPSAILGRLSANGQVFLINPNGVFFGQNAVVDVAGIVASTLNIRNEDFMNGTYRFTRDAGAPLDASVVNAGTINAGKGGYVVLAGDYVANAGLVQAHAGTALLAAGSAVTLQFAGSSLIDYAVNQATLAQLAGVANAGQILANGGRVIMTADVANQLAATVVNNTGLVQARSTVEQNGAIYMTGTGGSVANSGTLDASAQAGANGGHVDIRASGDILQQPGSLIDVSGADTGVSNAGSVYTWADGTNRFMQGASITARGGAQGGDGGQVEISGKKVAFNSIADLRAPHGRLGTLSLDPNYIYISTDGTDAGATGTPDSVIQESLLEGQLQVGNVTHTASGADARIVLGDLTDGTLDGTNGGTGGSLTLAASGAGASITFQNTANTIKVDGSLALTADDGSGGYAGTSINVGHLIAGQGDPTGGGANSNNHWDAALTLDAGSVAAASLTLGKAISTTTDTVYTLNAHAHDGNLTVAGNVSLDVANDTAASVKTSMSLLSDTGDVSAAGVTANATGKGYYHYTWDTSADGCGGAAATSCYSTYADRSQPWAQIHTGDHPITTALTISAFGNVGVAGATNALATDSNASFAGNGGYWQTATDTSQVFWRPTAPIATAAITATNGNATFGGTISVKADGYATASYGEIESWNDMIVEKALSTQSHTYYLLYWNGTAMVWDGGHSDSHSNVWSGGTTGNYVWSQSWVTLSGSDYGHNTPTSFSDSHSASGSTGMSYTGRTGPSATMTLDAGGNVSLNGLDVVSTNRSVSGTGSFSNSYWGRQDSNNVGASVSGNREVNYSDSFSTSFTVADAIATAAITAGTDKSITLTAGAANNVIASHTVGSASSDSQAKATLSLATGAGGTGQGTIALDGPITVHGADDQDITLAVTNHGGPINQATSGAAIDVTNYYSGGDARATFTADYAGADNAVGSINLDATAVTAGRAAYLSATADNNLSVSDAVSAYGSTRGQIDLTSTAAALTLNASPGDVHATATGSSGVALVNITGNTALSLNGGVTATADGSDGTATINLATDGGSTAAITQAASTTVAAHSDGAATINVDAGDGPGGTPTALNTADLTQAGALNATSANALASINVDAASGTVHDFNATGTSSGATASTTIKTWVGNLVLNGTEVVSGNATGNGATLAVNAAGALIAPTADIAVTNNHTGSNGDAGATLNANGGTASLGDATHGVSVSTSSSSGSASLSSTATGDLTNNGTLATSGNSGTSTASVSLTSSTGNVHLNNDISATGKSSATVSATSTVGTLTEAAGAPVSATANAGNASVTFNSAGDTALHDNLTADATGTATVGITASNAGADITQDALITIQATGATASTSIAAGSAGSFTLGGMTRADAASGTAGVAISGGSGSVHDLSAISTGSTATGSAITSAGALTLDHGATVSGNSTSATGAQLSLTGATSLDASGSTIAVTNNNTGGSAGASAALTASSGTAQLGAASVTGNGGGQAGFTAGATGNVTTAGSIAATANTGSQGTANIGLTSSAGNVTISHDLTATAYNDATVSATATSGTLTENASKTVTASSRTGTGTAVAFTSGGTMSIDGNITAATSSDGTVNGAHNGYATITLNTTGGSASSITQGAGSTIEAAATVATVTVKAGSSGTLNAGNAAAFNLQGSLMAEDVGGSATMNISGASGSVHDFDATAGNGTATTAITTYDSAGTLTLDGTGSVSGNSSLANGATLTVNAAGSLDASGAALTVANSNTGVSAGASASLTAGNGAAQLGTAAVTGHGGGQAGLTANATGDITTAGNIAATANTGSQGTANIGLTSSAGNVTISNDVSATGYFAATLAGTATTGTLTVDSGKTAASTATASSADTSFTSGSVLTVNGTVSASSANSTADTTLTSTAAPGSATNEMILAGTVSAASTTGTAAVLVNTTGGANARIDQTSGTILATGGSGSSVSIFAGAGSQAMANAALTLAGNVHAGYDGTNTSAGDASIVVGAGSAAVGNLAARSSAGTASASLRTNGGALTLSGTETVVANSSTGTGASFTATSATGVDARTATLSVTNNSTGNGAGASASLTASSGTAQLGAATVTGHGGGTVELQATATGNLTVANALTATSLGSGTAQVDLTSSAGSLTVGSTPGAVSALSRAGGAATVNLTGSTALTLNGDVLAAATLDGTDTGTKLGTATVNVKTSGGTGATITQAAATTVESVGVLAHTTVMAGDTDLANNTGRAATLALHGAVKAIDDAVPTAQVDISGASGTVHDFTASAGHAAGVVNITTYDTAGTLTLDGTGTVTGNSNTSSGAILTVDAAGNLDTTAANLTVSNSNTDGIAGAQAILSASNGTATLGPISVNGGTGGSAVLTASGSAGLAAVGALSANGSSNAISGSTATVTLSSGNGNVTLNSNVAADAATTATVSATATNGTLGQAAATTTRASARTGTATVGFTSGGAMTVNGNVTAASTSDGTVNGTHAGLGRITLNTTGGSSASITQGSASTVAAVGGAARVAVMAGDASLSSNTARAAAFNLQGSLQAEDAMSGAFIDVSGASGTVHDFSASALNTVAGVTITAYDAAGTLTLNGTGSVTGNYNAQRAAASNAGADLSVTAAGNLDSRAANLSVTNNGTGNIAGAAASFTAQGGSATLGNTTVSGNGGGQATLMATAATGMTITGNLAAQALNTGSGGGNSLVWLHTVGDKAVHRDITQNASTTVLATASGTAAGNATVDIQAGDCCASTVTLNGQTTAMVAGGSGTAGVYVRGDTINAGNTTAKITNAGTGNSMVSFGAPTLLNVTGILDSEAIGATARADIQLVSDKMTYPAGKAILSVGNGHVQLAPFNTGSMIGVHSDGDFDATPDIDYTLGTLAKFQGYQAEITFGGVYDRSSWARPGSEPTSYCVPGMDQWADKMQQTADIHVAGNGPLNLGDTKMVFDTTGITYYHDKAMSPWSVPDGRRAIYVAYPANVDRYLDRTDNSLQSMTQHLENTTGNSGQPFSGVQPGGFGGQQNTSQVSGNIFMAGDGLNLGGGSSGGFGGGTGGSGSGGFSNGGSMPGSAGGSGGPSGASGSGAGNGGSGATQGQGQGQDQGQDQGQGQGQGRGRDRERNADQAPQS